MDQAAANEFALVELVRKQSELLEQYRPALDRIANEENWSKNSIDVICWLGESHPLTIAQEALKVIVRGKEGQKIALHQNSAT